MSIIYSCKYEHNAKIYVVATKLFELFHGKNDRLFDTIVVDITEILTVKCDKNKPAQQHFSFQQKTGVKRGGCTVIRVLGLILFDNH